MLELRISQTNSTKDLQVNKLIYVIYLPSSTIYYDKLFKIE